MSSFEELEIHLIGGVFDGETFESDYFDPNDKPMAPDYLYVWRCANCSDVHHHVPEVVEKWKKDGNEPPGMALYGFTRFEPTSDERYGKAIYVLNALGVPTNSSWDEKLKPGHPVDREKEPTPA